MSRGRAHRGSHPLRGCGVRGVGPATGGGASEAGGSDVHHPATCAHASRVAVGGELPGAPSGPVSLVRRRAPRRYAARRADASGGVQVGGAVSRRGRARRGRVLVHRPTHPEVLDGPENSRPARPMSSAQDRDVCGLTAFLAMLVGRERRRLARGPRAARARRDGAALLPRRLPARGGRRAACARRAHRCLRRLRAASAARGRRDRRWARVDAVGRLRRRRGGRASGGLHAGAGSGRAVGQRHERSRLLAAAAPGRSGRGGRGQSAGWRWRWAPVPAR